MASGSPVPPAVFVASSSSVGVRPVFVAGVATHILKYLTQLEVFESRTTCTSFVSAAQQLTFAGQSEEHLITVKTLGVEGGTATAAIAAYKRMFPSAAAIRVHAAALTDADAGLLAGFSEVVLAASRDSQITDGFFANLAATVAAATAPAPAWAAGGSAGGAGAGAAADAPTAIAGAAPAARPARPLRVLRMHAHGLKKVNGSGFVHLTTLDELSLGRPSAAMTNETLRFPPSLTKLKLGPTRDLGPAILEGLGGLKHLAWADYSKESWGEHHGPTFADHCPQLESLSVAFEHGYGFPTPAGLNKLRDLRVTFYESYGDHSYFSNLPLSIERLRINTGTNNNGELSDEDLARLVNLRDLELHHAEDVIGEGLVGLSKLETLSLHYCNSLFQLKPLRKSKGKGSAGGGAAGGGPATPAPLPSLRKLIIDNCEMIDSEFLVAAAASGVLEEVRLESDESECNVDAEGIAALTACKTLSLGLPIDATPADILKLVDKGTLQVLELPSRSQWSRKEDPFRYLVRMLRHKGWRNEAVGHDMCRRLVRPPPGFQPAVRPPKPKPVYVHPAWLSRYAAALGEQVLEDEEEVGDEKGEEGDDEAEQDDDGDEEDEEDEEEKDQPAGGSAAGAGRDGDGDEGMDVGKAAAGVGAVAEAASAAGGCAGEGSAAPAAPAAPAPAFTAEAVNIAETFTYGSYTSTCTVHQLDESKEQDGGVGWDFEEEDTEDEEEEGAEGDSDHESNDDEEPQPEPEAESKHGPANVPFNCTLESLLRPLHDLSDHESSDEEEGKSEDEDEDEEKEEDDDQEQEEEEANQE